MLVRNGNSLKRDKHLSPLLEVSGKGGIPHSQACFIPSPFHNPGPGLAWPWHRCHIRGDPRATPTNVTPLPPACDHGPPQPRCPRQRKTANSSSPEVALSVHGTLQAMAGHGGGGEILAPGDRWLPLQMRSQVTKSASCSFFKDNLELWRLYLDSPNYLKIIKIACGLHSASGFRLPELSGSGKSRE